MAGCGWFGEEEGQIYVVVRGDTLTKIARTHNTTVEDVMAWNELSSDRIEVGQSLRLMHASSVPPKASAERTPPSQVKKARASGVQKPKAKACLKGPNLDDLDNDEVDIQGSQGLDMQQLRSTMGRFLPSLGVCFQNGWPTATVLTEVVVGCNGLVVSARVLDGDGLDSSVLSCLTNMLENAAFPEHDMPDGFTFQYPIIIKP